MRAFASSLLLLSTIAFTVACGDDRPPPSAPDSGGGTTDADMPDTGVEADARVTPDSGPDITGCGADALGTIIDIDTSTTGLQQRPVALSNGQSVFVAYMIPGEGGNLHIVGATIDCDGTVTAGPFDIADRAAGNNVSPVAAASGGTVLVGWLLDDQNPMDNLHVMVRRFGFDGSPMDAMPVEVRSNRSGAPVTGNHTDTTLTVDPTGAFIVGGSRANEGGTGFEPFAQRVDASLSPTGDALALTAPTESYTRTSIGASSTGVYAAFERLAASEVVYSELESGGTVAPAVTGVDEATEPFVANGEDGSGHVLMAVTVRTPGDINVRVVDLAGSAPLPFTTFGLPGVVDFLSRVTPAPGGGAIVFLRRAGTSRHNAYAQRFTYDGASFAAAPEQQVVGGAAIPVMPASLVHVENDLFFAVWVDRTGTETASDRLKGRYVHLPAP